MTKSSVVFSDANESLSAAREVCAKISADLNQRAPDALIVFLSPHHDYGVFLAECRELLGARCVVGCSSAGEFVSGRQGENCVSAIAICSDEIEFSSSVACGLREDRERAVAELVSHLQGWDKPAYPFRSMLMLTDALAGHTDALIDYINVATGGAYQIFGGGAGENAKFQKTHVFSGTRSETDAVVVLEILSKKPVGIGVQHGWAPNGKPLRVTEASGLRLISVNSVPAAEFVEAYASETGQKFDRQDPVPFFLHNAIGIQAGAGYKLRVPLAVEKDGSLLCASDIPVGATIRFMTATSATSSAAAASAVGAALKQLQGNKPEVALFFDCVATRLRLGGEFGTELGALAAELGDGVRYGGCNTYGQIARVDGQFSGFHNCTAVVCVIPS